MSMYRVTWEIDLDAGSPREAAELALATQRNPDSIATFFVVRGDGVSECIDLKEPA